jgi:hypothetical protein
MPRAAEDRAGAARKLAERIDRHIEAGWKANGIPAEPRADDGVFLRRLWLDLAGHIPPLTEVRDFLDDSDPDKRIAMADRLLHSDDYAQHTATHWVRSMACTTNGEVPLTGRSPLEQWLYEQIKAGMGQDRIVRTLVTSSRDTGRALEELFGHDIRPEELAAATTRLFLGVKVECVQCHDHPFAEWRREQFWQQAAFFTSSGSLSIPSTNRTVKALFLDGTVPKRWVGNGRGVLADWMTSPANPYFARAAVNRIWARHLGTGLVEPIVDFGTTSKPSHPELLQELADAFITSGFDERLITEAIVTSKAYQLSSAQPDARQADARLFARAAVRGLTSQQILENFRRVTAQAPWRAHLGDGDPQRIRFQALFPWQNLPAEMEPSILQALYLMNGPLMADATNPEKNRALRVLMASAETHPQRCVDELYEMVLGRPPRPAERERLVKYLHEGGPTRQPKRAVADVLWVLLNSSEFLLNH